MRVHLHLTSPCRRHGKPLLHQPDWHDALIVGKDVANVAFGDLPTAAGVAASLGAPMPGILRPSGAVGLNAVNLGLGAVGTGVDVHQMLHVFHDPTASSYDRKVEVGHLILTDIIPTATAVLPMLSLHSLLPTVVYVTTQTVGAIVDVAKTVHDLRRARRT